MNRSFELKDALGYAFDTALILVPTAGYLYLHATLGRKIDGYLPWIALVFVAIGVWRCGSHLMRYLNAPETGRRPRPMPIASQTGPRSGDHRTSNWARRIREANDGRAKVQAPLPIHLREEERRRQAAADLKERQAETLRQIRLMKR